MVSDEDFDIVEVPRRCSGCGRDADVSGMRHVGWAIRSPETGDNGAYCLGCASELRFLPWSATCAGCGRETEDEDAAEEAGWRFYGGFGGEFMPMCPDCARVEAHRQHGS